MSLPDPRHSRAVLIGTSEYESLPQLKAVTANVEHLRSLFATNDLWGLPPENCTVLLNREQPGEVLAAVREAAEAAQDTLVVYFAGHGLRSPDNDELYLALRTTVKDRMFTALRYDDLRRELLHAEVDVASKVVLLDCCYSGVAMRDTMSATDDVAERARIEGTYLMTASASTVLALAPQGAEHTAFTGEIIDAISAGIPDGPDLLNMEKLFWHVRGRLQAKGLPIPQQRAGNSGGMISLVRNRRGVMTEPGSVPRRRRLAEVPAGLEFALSAPPGDLVRALDTLAPAEGEALLAAIAGRVDAQEIAALLDYLPYADRADYTSVLLDAVVRDTPARLVELLATMRLLGQDSHVNDLLNKAVGLADGQASQLAELARLLRGEHPAESRRLIAAAIRAEAAASGPDGLISLVGAMWSAGLGDEIERTLRESDIDLGDVDALALAKALNSAGRSELAVTLYLRGLDAVAALADEEIVAIVRTARECERAEDAGKLVRAASRHRESGAQYTKFATALWAAGLAEDADQVLDVAASRLGDAELKHVATSLRGNNHAEAAFELYRKAASGRPAPSVVEFAESLRASGRPVDAIRLLSESATRGPAELAGILAELRRRDRPSDVDRFSALVAARPPEELTQVIVGLLNHGVEDLALRYRDLMLRSAPAHGIVDLVRALSTGPFTPMAHECAVWLITEPSDGPELFAGWLSQEPAEVAGSFLPVVAALDHGRALAVAKHLHELRRADLSSGLVGLIRFESAQGFIAAFRTANWQEGLEEFYKSNSQTSLDDLYAEFEQLTRSGQQQAAALLVEQSAVYRPAEQIPTMLEKFVRSGDVSATAAVNAAVGRYRAPSDIAEILNVLNLKGRRLNKCAPAILAAAAGRNESEVYDISQRLGHKMLDHYARELNTKRHARTAG